MIFEPYDIVVVGAGHAGAEAAAAAAKLGAKVLRITQMLDNICQMSCNPAMGGVAKGQIVREVDALGGWSGIVTDRSAIQFRMLNRSKGPAMWSPRAQCDRMLFSQNWRSVLESIPNLSLWQDEVTALVLDGGTVSGVQTRMGHTFPARAVVLTSGTFLNGRIYIGESAWSGGRVGEAPAVGLSDQLRDLGFEVERLKTGTPVRIDGQEQRPCYVANTNLKTHDILRTGFSRSPMFTGRIQGRGPRYCPSIEDKIDRFADKDHHQLFVEPEGWHSQSWYLNGFSSSLPLEVQLEALRSISGFEQAQIFKPGYAIEYDYFPPTQLVYTLETKRVENLYFAGQVNGTTGYEEAACQGLMAAVNAALKLKGKAPLVLGRSQAYIGVLIDDLVTKGVDEPYRMFTSRAEYRILLRQDNADQRLTPLSHAIGLADDDRMRRVEEKVRKLEEHGSAPLNQRVRLSSLLLRPELTLDTLSEVAPAVAEAMDRMPEEVVQEVETGIKYQRYIEKEQEVANRILKFEEIKLSAEYDYMQLTALSYEAREKLNRYRPVSIGQASRISGISPADVSVLLLTFAR